MLGNRLVWALAIASGGAPRSIASPSALPVVDLGYSVHQATFNKVVTSPLLKENRLEIHARSQSRYRK
jgi:hypothetical protein